MIRDFVSVILNSSIKRCRCRMVCTAGHGTPFFYVLLCPYLGDISQVTLEFISEDNQHISDFIKRDLLLKMLSAFRPIDVSLVFLRDIFSSLKNRFIKSADLYLFAVMHHIYNSIKLTYFLSGLIISSYPQIGNEYRI